MRGFGIVLLVMALLGSAGLAWVRGEGKPPRISAPDSALVGSPGHDFELTLLDPESGLRSAVAVLAHAAGEEILLDESFPGSVWSGGTPEGHERTVTVFLDPETLEVPEGEAFLRVAVRDWSWRGGFGGNQTLLEIPVSIDLSPPRVSVESGLTYVKQGGSGAVVYTVSEAPRHDGVRVGEAFFPGFAFPGSDPASGRRVALFAVPADAPEDAKPRVVTSDPAGNEANAGWPVEVRRQAMPATRVDLSKRFLEIRVRALSLANRIDPSELTAAFEEINTRMRAANEKQIRKLLARTAPEPLFQGAFVQMANSKVTSRFAEQRSYYYAGIELSEAVHFGFDLASSRAAPVAAANSGTVLFADDLGIYGGCVLLDHGLGLASLYGHLSRLDVEAGDSVAKGGMLGLSGATGLAGGDHLHFAILVSGTYVDPMEWWDPKWVESHVTARLRPSPR